MIFSRYKSLPIIWWIAHLFLSQIQKSKMTSTRVKVFISLQSRLSSHFLSRVSTFCSKASTTIDKANETTEQASLQERLTSYSSKIHLSPLLGDSSPHLDGYNFELVDDDAWQVSSSLVHAWRGLDREKEAKSVIWGIRWAVWWC
jgi:large subunit ribosomal protein L18